MRRHRAQTPPVLIGNGCLHSSHSVRKIDLRKIEGITRSPAATIYWPGVRARCRSELAHEPRARADEVEDEDLAGPEVEAGRADVAGRGIVGVEGIAFDAIEEHQRLPARPHGELVAQPAT